MLKKYPIDKSTKGRTIKYELTDASKRLPRLKMAYTKMFAGVPFVCSRFRTNKPSLKSRNINIPDIKTISKNNMYGGTDRMPFLAFFV